MLTRLARECYTMPSARPAAAATLAGGRFRPKKKRPRTVAAVGNGGWYARYQWARAVTGTPSGTTTPGAADSTSVQAPASASSCAAS